MRVRVLEEEEKMERRKEEEEILLTRKVEMEMETEIDWIVQEAPLSIKIEIEIDKRKIRARVFQIRIERVEEEPEDKREVNFAANRTCVRIPTWSAL